MSNVTLCHLTRQGMQYFFLIESTKLQTCIIELSLLGVNNRDQSNINDIVYMSFSQTFYKGFDTVLKVLLFKMDIFADIHVLR